MPILPATILLAFSTIEGMSLAEIEKAYWDCEFAATQGAIGLDEAAACSEIFEHLKAENFGGDFQRFIAWWRENKERELTSRRNRKLPQRHQ